jgi:hypothetical protein
LRKLESINQFQVTKVGDTQINGVYKWMILVVGPEHKIKCNDVIETFPGLKNINIIAVNVKEIKRRPTNATDMWSYAIQELIKPKKKQEEAND